MAQAPRGRPRCGQARGPGPRDRAGAQAGVLSDGGCVGGLVGSHPGVPPWAPPSQPTSPAPRASVKAAGRQSHRVPWGPAAMSLPSSPSGFLEGCLSTP